MHATVLSPDPAPIHRPTVVLTRRGYVVLALIHKQDALSAADVSGRDRLERGLADVMAQAHGVARVCTSHPGHQDCVRFPPCRPSSSTKARAVPGCTWPSVASALTLMSAEQHELEFEEHPRIEGGRPHSF